VSSDVPKEYLNYIICKEMGWTHEELMSQPRHFVEEMMQVISIKQKIERKHG